jgi:hypothetical protein
MRSEVQILSLGLLTSTCKGINKNRRIKEVHFGHVAGVYWVLGTIGLVIAGILWVYVNKHYNNNDKNDKIQ